MALTAEEASRNGSFFAVLDDVALPDGVLKGECAVDAVACTASLLGVRRLPAVPFVRCAAAAALRADARRLPAAAALGAALALNVSLPTLATAALHCSATMSFNFVALSSKRIFASALDAERVTGVWSTSTAGTILARGGVSTVRKAAISN